MKTTMRKLSNRPVNAARNGQEKRRMERVRPAEGVAIASILVPTDFSKPSENALAYAIPLARQIGAKLTLLHVIEPIATADFTRSFPLAIENEKAKEFCERVLAQTAGKVGIEAELLDRKLVRFGTPYHEIANAARTLKTDLIIIATHGYTGLKHAFLGSTAERVVRHAPCPVLVVRRQTRTGSSPRRNRRAGLPGSDSALR